MMPHRHRAMVLTPPGAGAIAVIKLIGPDPVGILEGSLDRSIVQPSSPYGKLSCRRFMDGDEVLDDVLVSVERVSENEQAVEISCHGGIRVVQRILELCERRGATVESNPTASLSHWAASNKIEEEAIAALAGAKTERAARYASLLRTGLPEKIESHLTLCDVDLNEVRRLIAELAAGYTAARSLLQGITIPLIGPPNSGKSTLLNSLLGRQAVVTSPVPGTTRDWVMESVEFQGVPANLVDTAGRRKTDSELEQLAIEASDSLLHESSAFLLVFDGSLPIPENAFGLLEATTRKCLVVANKSDLEFHWSKCDLEFIRKESGTDPVLTSALTGDGCEMLRRRILEHFGLANPDHPPLAFFTDRQARLAAEISCPDSGPKKLLAALLGERVA